jgi:hypothetical protein
MSCANPLNQPLYQALINKATATNTDTLYSSATYLKASQNVANSAIDFNQYLTNIPAVQTYELNKVYNINNKPTTNVYDATNDSILNLSVVNKYY